MSEPDLAAGNGIHHVTAPAGDPLRNVEFYAGVLGLRLVKKTVNFDDPSTYHLYYGNENGAPGTTVTFFPRDGARQGTAGPGQVTLIGLRALSGSLEYWRERLTEAGAVVSAVETRFGKPKLRFLDTDRLALEIVGEDDAAPAPWAEGTVAAEHALRGIAGVTLTVRRPDRTVELLSDLLGHAVVAEESDVVRMQAGTPHPTFVDVRPANDDARGRGGAGTVHHVAFRARDEEEQKRLREAVLARGLRVTEVLDRQYFRSIYFREPSGVLFEIATDGPGFTADETVDELGSGLRLPPWLESGRAEIEAALPAL